MNNGNALDSQLLDLMLRAGSSWVLYLLMGLSVAALAVMLERLWFFLQERRPAGAIADALAALRSAGPAAALAKLTDTRSMEAAVARACPPSTNERRAPSNRSGPVMNGGWPSWALSATTRPSSACSARSWASSAPFTIWPAPRCKEPRR
jgi:hypothetical protein